MKQLKPVKRLRAERLLKGETTVSTTEATGLIPALPQDDFEEESIREMYTVHKARRT